ncbi:hypothetical protein B0I37DRAFT_443000 [Chaetomium sp. MPI-CAGE-AT-0009]|nr:hypothetical protein B0I37DRAFT_443000 [Chaetomium sp. MPI-CAGE-AT-0009]
MDEEQDTEDLALDHLKKHIDGLDPDLDLLQPPTGVRTVLRSGSRELDRLIGNVDLVSYQAETDTEPPATRKAVFKYYWHTQFVGKIWDDVNLWLRLPHHPNIVPIDRLVLDEVRGGVVGFTTLFIPGGTLEDNVSRTFKLKWCRQLMDLVDDLNLRYGIAHQDIVPRNLLVDESRDDIMLFDFNWSAQIGHYRGPFFSSYWDNRDDVRAVVFAIYEIITRDFHFREEGKQITVYTDAPEYIDRPSLEIPTQEWTSSTGTVMQSQTWAPVNRSKALALGEKTVEWRRPRQSTLKGDYLGTIYLLLENC